MKPYDPQGKIPCELCGHLKEMHMNACGDRDCDCLLFLPPHGAPGKDEDNPVDSWQEACIFAVLNLILDEKEGEIHVQTRNGGECHIKVSLVEGIGMSMTGAGKC